MQCLPTRYHSHMSLLVVTLLVRVAGTSLFIPPPGSFGNATGASTLAACHPCEAGFHAREEGRSFCDRCPAGSSEPGQTVCTLCQPGKFANSSNGRTLCTNCARGRYSGLGETSCTACERGTYTTDGKTCKACPAGTFGAEEGLDSQLCSGKCPPGYYSDNYASNCTACAPGKYAEDPRSSTCQHCEGDHFVSKSGARQCECQNEYYYDKAQNAVNGTCSPCPTGAECKQGTTLETLSLEPGFWRASESSAAVIKCPYEASCTAQASSNAPTSKASGYCAKGYKGPVCGMRRGDNQTHTMCSENLDHTNNV